MKVDNNVKQMSDEIVRSAQVFFRNFNAGNLPPHFDPKNGGWIVLTEKWYCCLIYLTKENMQRINDFRQKGWHPFPALFSPQENGPAAYTLGQGIAGSNKTSNMYAFSVSQESSFIIQNHTHSIKINDVEKITYKVDLAFVVGFEKPFNIPVLKKKFNELFKKVSDVKW